MALTLASFFYRAVNGEGARGPWFGALAVVVHGWIFAGAALAQRSKVRRVRGPRKLETALFPVFFGALMFVTVGSLTSLTLWWCTAIAVTATAALGLLVYSLRHTRQRRVAGASPTTVL